MPRLRAAAIAAVLLGMLAGAAPAAAADPPTCWNPEVWARPGLTHSYQLYCPRTERVVVLSEPHNSRFEGLVQGESVRFRLTPDADAPRRDSFTLGLTGPGGTTEQVIEVHNTPLSENTPPRCDPVSVAQRTPGTAPVAIEFHVVCWDSEHDDYTLYGGGPGSHPDAPLLNPGGEGGQAVPFWHYVPTILDGEEQTTYYAVDALGGRSADAPISVQVGPSVDRLPTCRPNPAYYGGEFVAIRSRPGATRRFAVICEDVDGDPLRAGVQALPSRGDLTAFDPANPSLGWWGAQVWIDVTYVPRTPYEGEDRFEISATGPRGDGPPGAMGIVARPLPDNYGGGCGWSPGVTPPGQPVTLEATCDDADGDRLSAEVTSPPAHGTAGEPTLTSGAYGMEKLRIPYTPAAGFEGDDSVTIAIGDAGGTSQSLDFAVYVHPPAWVAPPGYTIGTPFDWPELHPPPAAATWLPSIGQAAPVSPLVQARRALGSRSVRLVARVGDARVYASRRPLTAAPRRRALAVTCPVRCSVTSTSTVAGGSAGDAKLRVKPGRAAALALVLSRRQRDRVRRAGSARAVFRLGVARTGGKARRATVRLAVRG